MVAIAATGSDAADRQKKIVLLKIFISGGVAGCCAKTTVAPFDRVKILLQAHNKTYRHLGVFQTLKKVVHKEGFVGLYKGNGAQMVRIFPYAAVQFASYEKYKVFFKTVLGDNRPIIHKLLSGSFAGLTAVITTYPLDMIRARLAFQVTGEHKYTGIIHAFKSITSQEGGLRGLYRGIVPTVLGVTPYAGLSFCGFETLKNLCLHWFPNALGKPSNTGNLVLIIPGKLICGGLAGAVAQTVSYPLDVARRRMQLAMMLPDSHKFKTWHSTLIVVFREHGIRRGLYRGLSVNYIRVMPMVAVSFCVYELTKQALGLDTGADS